MSPNYEDTDWVVEATEYEQEAIDFKVVALDVRTRTEHA